MAVFAYMDYRYSMNTISGNVLLLVFASGLCACTGFSKQLSANNTVEYPAEYQIVKPSHESARVFFYSPRQFANGSFIYENDRLISIIKSGSFSYVIAAPGRHTYLADMGRTSAITFDVEAGADYYIKFYVNVGFWGSDPVFELVPENTGKAAILDLKYGRLPIEESN